MTLYKKQILFLCDAVIFDCAVGAAGVFHF